jgi:transcriptional antiterminator RfaH
MPENIITTDTKSIMSSIRRRNYKIYLSRLHFCLMQDRLDKQKKETDMQAEENRDSKVAWFCLRSQPKHEHIATAHLRRQKDIDVFFPRIRFKRATRTGSAWVTEALFPNYLFARFDWVDSLRLVHHSPGVSEVVHFGWHWPVVPNEAIEEMRTCLGDNEVHVIPPDVSPGDAVQIAGGCMHGLRAVVAQIMPDGKRVAILLDFLGRQTSVKLDVGMVIKEANERGLVGKRVKRASS